MQHLAASAADTSLPVSFTSHGFVFPHFGNSVFPCFLKRELGSEGFLLHMELREFVPPGPAVTELVPKGLVAAPGAQLGPKCGSRWDGWKPPQSVSFLTPHTDPTPHRLQNPFQTAPQPRLMAFIWSKLKIKAESTAACEL